jgi:hypothetical protein
LVAIIAIGKKEKTNISLLLFAEIKKITTLIRTAKNTFLYEACKFKGLFGIEKIKGKTKNTRKTAKIEKAMF